MGAPGIDAWSEGLVCLRSTDKAGAETYTAHRCWNKARFVMCSHEAALKEGGKAEQISIADYQRATGKRP